MATQGGQGLGRHDLVFCYPLGQVLNMEVLSIQARRFRDAAGVPADVSPVHGYRHYSLTQLHKVGVDGLTIRIRACHADIRSTQGYVTIDSNDDWKAAAAVAGSLLLQSQYANETQTDLTRGPL
jgi:integrase